VVPELNVLIAGDQVLPKISTNVGVWPNEPQADALTWFLDGFSRFRRLPADALVLPSHGFPFIGLHTQARPAGIPPRCAPERHDCRHRPPRRRRRHGMGHGAGAVPAPSRQQPDRLRLRRDQRISTAWRPAPA
jgi:glyoxylase-like metal-dependent hydrolase (beta-lactamase superfamily II)